MWWINDDTEFDRSDTDLIIQEAVTMVLEGYDPDNVFEDEEVHAAFDYLLNCLDKQERRPIFDMLEAVRSGVIKLDYFKYGVTDEPLEKD